MAGVLSRAPTNTEKYIFSVINRDLGDKYENKSKGVWRNITSGRICRTNIRDNIAAGWKWEVKGNNIESGRKPWQVAGKVTSPAIYFIICRWQGYVARDRKS